MKVHIITKTYDNNSSVIDRTFTSRKRAEKYLEKEVETYIADGYTHTWYLGRVYEKTHEILKNGDRKYIYRIESVEAE